MVARWQCVGYVHGVMNTDNMSILGLTIDYGPFGFMEHYNPRLVSNQSDQEARYCYENQPSVCKWNLMRLAEALDPLIPLEESSMYIESHYDELYTAEYLTIMGKKIGVITEMNPEKDSLSEDEFQLIKDLFKVMEETSSDFTNTFRALMKISNSPDFSESDTLPLLTLEQSCAPLEHRISKKRSKYSPQELLKL